MKQYRLLNNITGWIVFAIAAVVYLLTIEPTASLWDCGEFIASCFKLEVGHPPGNPIFMLVGNLFTQLSADTAGKAVMLNSMSALCSAFTILFLFWTITHLVKKLLIRDKIKISGAQTITTLACGAVGALAYTFSDTFWFSAVEGEVYAFSSLMTALVFWLILKWEDVADEPHSDRWLILLAYLMGVSIAIHLLNLLCIPAIVLVYYYKKNPNANLKGSLLALLASFAIVAALLYGIIQGVVKVAGWFELLFVNSLSMPYNSGVVFYVIAVAGVLVWGIWETMREKYDTTRIKISFLLGISLAGIPFLGNSIAIWIIILLGISIYIFTRKKINPVALNSIMLGILVIMIGYSSYALIMIRSTANTPMDENSPEDIFSLRTYLSREQYGDTPLFYGPTYVAETKWVKTAGNSYVTAMKDEGPVYTRVLKKDPNEKDRYFVSQRKEKPVFIDELNMLFPRMYSRNDARHIEAYKSWANIKGKRVTIHDPNGETHYVMKPTFIENIRFFLNYQVNFMYIRYFMWNFSGRQNDIQGHGEVSNGNWITGIPFIDNYLVGPQKDLPDFIAKNKGHNVYYMLPLILGLLGIAFQISKGRKGIEGFWITFLLFFMTGLAIVVYLNQTPYQPRERDYAYAGSFYAFCIWIGIGAAYVIQLLNRYLKLSNKLAAPIGGLICLLVPLQMASQSWDDHDRSNRYMTRDFGYNYLATCEPNAILFTMGDNDTFPLWYGQEVEGYRTDVRVCNLSYLQTDWYADQMKRQAYESAPLPISFTREEYLQGKHDQAFLFPQTQATWELSRALARIKSDDPRTKRVPGYSTPVDNIPTYNLALPVDKEAALKTGTVKPEFADRIVDTININLGNYQSPHGRSMSAKRYLGKEELMVLDMLDNNKWERPMYYAVTVGPEEYCRLENYFRQDGVAYRIVPYKTSGGNDIDTDILFDNLVNKYRWGGLEKKGLYVDENMARLARTFRTQFGQLGRALIREGKKDSAIVAMDVATKYIPSFNVPYDYYSSAAIAQTYFAAGDTAKAQAIYEELVGTSIRELDWYSRLRDSHYATVLSDVKNSLSTLYYVNQEFYFFIDPEYSKQLDEIVNQHNMQLAIFSEKLNGRNGKNR